MDGRLKARVQALTIELAREEQARLHAAGTLVELEELACEIGDEFTSQLMSLEMGDRANRAAESVTRPCPDCGDACGQGNLRPRELIGLRGAVRYQEPTFHCPACRRSFFPGGGAGRPFDARDGDTQVVAKDGLGGGQPEQL